VPLAFSRDRIERDHRTRKEIVALADTGVEVGTRIPNAPEQNVLIGIVAASEPSGDAKHGRRYELLPRQQEGNPMNWVSQRTTSDYTAVPMTPKQAFEILLNIPEPRRTLTLRDAATALRVSELLALMWTDLDFADLVMYVRRAYVWGRFKVPKSKASKAPVPMHPLLAGFLLAWRDKTPFGKDTDFVFPSGRLKGKKPLSASIMVQKYLRPAAVKAGVIKEGEKVRFGSHNFRHALATALVKLRVDAKTVQGILRHEDFGTTMQLYAQSDMESMREAQGKFLEQLLGDRIHLLTERVQ
jgi:integrase